MTDSLTDVFKKEQNCSDMFRPPDEITKRFDIIERLAENDHGETYLLTDKESSERYVLKCYKKSKTASETRESEILRELKHEGLPAFIKEIEDSDILYVLREYADGVQLNKYIDEHGGIDERKATGISVDLCDILTYLHSQPNPVIHRDVKPSNIILNPLDNTVKLIDFGISRRFSKDADSDTEYYGTKKFSPPEQYGFSQTDNRTDIYALGIVLRYMLTGSVDGQVNNKSLSKIINKCTAFSPSDRYKNAAALKKDLVRYRNGTRRRTLKILATVLTLCVVLSIGFAIGLFVGLNIASEQGNGLADGNERIVFFEPLIEENVRLMLGKTEGEPVLHRDLKNITALYVHGMRVFDTVEGCADWVPDNEEEGYGNIVSLEDIRRMENLLEIYLQGQPVTDLTPLADCKLLEKIDIVDSPVSEADLTPLENLPELWQLNLIYCNLMDLMPLNNFTEVRHLDIAGAHIDDISGLELYQLRLLRISSTQVSSLDGIERFTSLYELDIDRTNITDFSPLDNLPSLNKLIISFDMDRYLPTMTREDVEVHFW